MAKPIKEFDIDESISSIRTEMHRRFTVAFDQAGAKFDPESMVKDITAMLMQAAVTALLAQTKLNYVCCPTHSQRSLANTSYDDGLLNSAPRLLGNYSHVAGTPMRAR